MPARAVDRWARLRLTRAVGNGPYPGCGPADRSRSVFTEVSVINSGRASPHEAGRAPQAPHRVESEEFS